MVKLISKCFNYDPFKNLLVRSMLVSVKSFIDVVIMQNNKYLYFKIKSRREDLPVKQTISSPTFPAYFHATIYITNLLEGSF